MAPLPPTPNDIIVLRILATKGEITTARMEAHADFLGVNTMARSQSQPGRYFLERMIARGWARKRVDSKPGARKFVSYLVTDEGRAALSQFTAPAIPPTMNGVETVGEV